ncbi:MAG: DUF3791 domain-containing protein [Treponema sp.]|nr:DUF3791 domain-containing protein [Treponema sp.]
MRDSEKKKRIRYKVACISEFAKSKSLTKEQAFRYLKKHKALDFLDEFYDVEHTLSLADAVSDITRISQQNGGMIE